MPARENMLRVRIGNAGLAAIDKARNNWTRSEYIRRAVAKAINEGVKGPTTNGDTL